MNIVTATIESWPGRNADYAAIGVWKRPEQTTRTLAPSQMPTCRLQTWQQSVCQLRIHCIQIGNDEDEEASLPCSSLW